MYNCSFFIVDLHCWWRIIGGSKMDYGKVGVPTLGSPARDFPVFAHSRIIQISSVHFRFLSFFFNQFIDNHSTTNSSS
ncbi:hypothetical protein VN97_g3307 [Penicillium thymicola]|uniref:Uncharacterized protein n=1 Tax=Penicillium thymicola TaxID=293382 RepID=A0AAI9XAX6_PENTH|nr:hypothetical protein VN97_g3307 [Penicillium thymicola]